jgi:hypothetical protein
MFETGEGGESPIEIRNTTLSVLRAILVYIYTDEVGLVPGLLCSTDLNL